VEEDKMTAKLEDGVLTLRLPLKEVAKPRQIPVL
jgi:HSP20 family protein